MKHTKIVSLLSILISVIVISGISNPATAQTSSANQNGLLFRSTDGGATWQSVIDPDKNLFARQAKKIVIDPTNSAIIYLVTDRGLFKSADNGATFNDSNNGLANQFVIDLVIDPANPQNLYLITPASLVNRTGGLYRSSDAGRTWQSIPLNFEAPPAYAYGNSYLTPTSLAITALNPSKVYPGARGTA